jgi:hypothetical protein
MTKTPCTGCDRKTYCELGKVACKQFSNFVTYGRFSADTPKIPTMEMYDSIFDEDDLTTQIWDRKAFV